MDSQSLNLDDYDVNDLLDILNLTDPTEFQVKDSVNTIVARLKQEKKDDMAKFFEQARDKIIDKLNESTLNLDYEDESKIDDVWKDSSFSPEGDPNTNYFDDNTHFPIKNIASKAATAAPKIISTRLVVIDSQFRTDILPYAQNSIQPSFTTRFAFNLANPVNNAISIRLYSYQIPTSWYVFNASTGNTFFQYNGVIIQIPEGNYSITSLVTTINTIAALDPATAGLVVSGPDPINGKLSFTNNDPFAISTVAVFYVQGNTANLSGCGQKIASLFQTVGINNTLGWMLGFRTTPDPITGDVFITINTGQTVTADVPPTSYGPKYFLLNVEDFNNQRLTSGVTNITHTKNLASLTVPDYYKTIYADCQLQSGSLTKAQLYSINTLIADNTPTLAARYTNKIIGPNASSTFAVIPLANVDVLRAANMPIVQFGANLYMFERRYIKPIRLERLRVSLIDDKGNLVDLNDNDWSFTLIVEQMIG